MKNNLKSVGMWGQLHYQHLKKTKPSIIGVMRMKKNLIPYLQSVDEQANEMLFQLVKQLAKQEGATEELKRRDQMTWGAGLRQRPLPKAEAPTEAAGETPQQAGLYPQIQCLLRRCRDSDYARRRICGWIFS